MGRAKGRPNNKTIKAVVEFLAEHGLTVYGQCMDLDANVEYCALMDYDADDVIKFLRLDPRKTIDGRDL